MKVREQKIFKKKFTKSFIIKKEEETIQYTLVSFVDMWRTTGMKKKDMIKMHHLLDTIKLEGI
jgi:DNA-binding transcriptional regulator YhcF (GntR family)